jgi:hypothetical protein
LAPPSPGIRRVGGGVEPGFERIEHLAFVTGADGLPQAVEEPLHQRVARHRRAVGETDSKTLFEATGEGEPAVGEEIACVLTATR